MEKVVEEVNGNEIIKAKKKKLSSLDQAKILCGYFWISGGSFETPKRSKIDRISCSCGVLLSHKG